MQELLEYIIKSLVSQPDKVEISEETGDNTVNFNLTVAQEDMGIVIGRSGQTIKAVRKLLIARTLAENKNLTVRVNLQETK